MPTLKKSQSGFSLVELLVAIVILAVGLLGLAQLQVTAIKANSQSTTSTASAALAQRVVEEIAAMPADDAMFDGPGSGTWGSAVLDGAGTYDITYDVTAVKASGVDVTNLFRVEVTVTSTADLMHVLGNQKREVKAFTLKRAI